MCLNPCLSWVQDPKHLIWKGRFLKQYPLKVPLTDLVHSSSGGLPIQPDRSRRFPKGIPESLPDGVTIDGLNPFIIGLFLISLIEADSNARFIELGF